MENKTTALEMARMIAELRDSLVQLSTCLKDLQFENSPSANQSSLTEVNAILERIRCNESRAPGG